MGNAAAIDRCLNVGEVVGGTGFTGGITGYSNGAKRWISNSVNLGAISATSSQLLGGFGQLKSSEVVTNCFNLSTATAAFATNAAGTPGPVDPADNTTWANGSGALLNIVNCANLATVDEIFTAIEAAVPGLFAKDNGSLKFA
jgi:hypothetical protein